MKPRDPKPVGRSGNGGPRVIEITPDGRRLVDPMSIIESEPAQQHLEDISRSRTSERTTPEEEPSE